MAPRYNEVSRYRIKMFVIVSYLVNNKNIRYSGVTKLNQAEQWDIHHAKQTTDFEGQSFPVLTNRSRVWLVNHSYHHVVFTECER